MLPDEVIKKIQFEIAEINEEISAYHPLFKQCKIKEPDFIEMAALASSLHSFYNGIEKIFIIIAKSIDNQFPSGQKWHHELLNEMKTDTNNRENVISNETFNSLRKYLLFRHYYRHSYSWRLKWDEFSELIFDLEPLWENMKAELDIFLND